MSRLLLVVVSLIACSAAQAAEILGCFTASYDAAHFVKYPGQTPTSLSLRIYKDDFYIVFDVTATLKDKPGSWGEAGGCAADRAGTLTCSVDCDGGGFKVRANGDGVTLSNGQGFRVALESCGEGDRQVIKAVPGNRRFTLRKADDAACDR